MPLSAITTRSAGTLSNTAVRAFCESLAISSKVNSRPRRVSASLGRSSASAVQHVLDLVALHLVDDVGDLGMGVGAGVARDIEQQILVQRALQQAHHRVHHRARRQHAPHQARCAGRAASCAMIFAAAPDDSLDSTKREGLRMLLLQIGGEGGFGRGGQPVPHRLVGIAEHVGEDFGGLLGTSAPASRLSRLSGGAEQFGAGGELFGEIVDQMFDGRRD